MEKQLSLDLNNLSSRKKKSSSLKQHFSGKRKQQQNPNKQKKQLVTSLLSKKEKEINLKTLSLENKTQDKKISRVKTLNKNCPNKGLLFDNLMDVEIVAEVLGLAPKTIRNWVSARRIPFVRVGRKVMFRQKSFELWLNRKEIKSWQ